MKSQPTPEGGAVTRVTRSGLHASTKSGNGIQGPSPPKNQNQVTRPPTFFRPKSTKGKGKKGGGKFKIAYTNRKTTRILSESGNNELSKEDLSYLTDEEKLLLSSWGLPRSVLDKYRSKGITSLFPWQLDCLANEKVLEGCNLLYSAPTSAGKTLVAEILMIKRVLELGKKAMMILPFVSVAREKMYSLQELFGDAGVRVEGFMGSYNPPGGFQQIDIAICTIEKANSLINRMLEEGTLSQLGTIVVDELHLIGDPHRGYLLELLLTKIRYMTSEKPPMNTSLKAVSSNDSSSRLDAENMSSTVVSKLNIQIVGMSATLPNLDLLARWLQAELVTTDYRPVPLVERIMIGDNLYDRQLDPVRPVATELIPFEIANDSDHMVYLCLETILGGHSILVFCPTKAMCESVALQIAKDFYQIGNVCSVTSTAEVSAALREQLDGARILDVIKQLEQCPAGRDECLHRTVSFGVAFHHAGLTFDERDILESAFKRGILRVIVATSTLSAGVNLPARRVIIKAPDFGTNLDVLTYHQMSGRAGRKGVDTEGESILMCNALSQRKSITLIQSALLPVSSALVGENGSLTSSMKRALLEVIASGVASTPAQVNAYAQCTLLSLTMNIESEGCSTGEMKSLSVVECLEFLETNEFIRLQEFEREGRGGEYMPTQLGSACLASSLSPDEGILVFKELQKARQCFVLQNELHVVYQVTPIYVADQWGSSLDWQHYFKLWEGLSADQQKVGELVGVQENFILRAWQGLVSSKNPRQAEAMNVHIRFYTALALSDLVNEMPIGAVCEKYFVNKGVVQNLQQAASTFAGMVTCFCGRLGWSNLELLLSQFQERLQFGVQRELVDLVRLSLLNGQRARVLYDAGVKTIADLATSEPSQIEHILHKAGPFSSTVHGAGSSSGPSTVWMIGKKEGVSEKDAATLIVSEARDFLKVELGLPNIQFSQGLSNNPRLVSHDHEVEESESESESDKENMAADVSASQRSVRLEDTRSRSVLRHSTNHEHDREVPKSGFLETSVDLFGDTFPSFDERDLIGMDGCQETKSPAQDALNKSIRPHNHSSILANGMHGNPSTEMLPTNNSPLVITGKVLKTSTPLTSLIQTPSPSQQNHVQPMEDEFDFEREFLQNKFESSDAGEVDVFMDSVASCMEVSLIISENGDSPEKKQNGNIPNRKSSDSYKLSESVLAAAIAMAEADDSDGGFSNGVESESIFDESLCDEEDEVIQCSSEPVLPTLGSSGKEAEDLLGSLNDPMCRRTFKSVTFQGQTIQVRTVETSEFIPREVFEGIGPIGVGIHLQSAQRSNSMSRAGIGAKILRTSGSVKTPVTARNAEVAIDQSVTIYAHGSSTLWVLQWKKESGRGRQMISGRSKVAGLFRRLRDSRVGVCLLDSKEKLKRLLTECRTDLDLSLCPHERLIWDPKIADWLLSFQEDQSLSLDTLIHTYLGDDGRGLRRAGWTTEMAEAFWAAELMHVLRHKLEQAQLWTHFTEIEMPSTRPLLLMEMNGLGLNSTELERMKKVLEFKAALLELRAYQIAGRQFNISSPKDIRQVLFREIGLTQPVGSKGTGKDVLSRLDHELPKVIMEWRKVTCALTKVVIPFHQERNLATGRVHGVYSHFTLTGRVIQAEPSLQCVPRDFELSLDYSRAEIEQIRHNCRIKFGSKLVSLFFKLENVILNEDCSSISMRRAFVPSSDHFVLLSADYCQLELRLLAHFSGDTNLRRVLNEPGDVFRSIASQWKNVRESEVTNEMRQETKTIVYAIIYGMGVKTLSEQMELEELQASSFMTQFMRAYPGIRSCIDKTVRGCRELGYVETISGRRRYLPHINSRSATERAQAERQAVNSRIQGSASDLVKRAMTGIQARLAQLYPSTNNPVNWKALRPEVKDMVYFPVLNLHDELMYEVQKSHVPHIAREIQAQMESCLQLTVSLPVVIKTGNTWSSLSTWKSS